MSLGRSRAPPARVGLLTRERSCPVASILLSSSSTPSYRSAARSRSQKLNPESTSSGSGEVERCVQTQAKTRGRRYGAVVDPRDYYQDTVNFHSLDTQQKLSLMDPLAAFCMVILTGEIYETFKLLRGSSWVTSPIRFFGLLRSF